MSFLVTQDFLDGAAVAVNNTLPAIGFTNRLPNGPFEPPNLVPTGLEIASALQSNIPSLRRLENTDCIRTYGTDFVTNYLNVLVITNNPHSQAGSVLAVYEYHAAPASYDVSMDILNHNWICGIQSSAQVCDVPSKLSQASTWYFNVTGEGRNYVSYCLAQPVEPECTVEILLPALIIVILFNIIKAICFTTLLLKRTFTPLMILGDAIASFMTDPDPTALNYGPLSAESVRKAYIADPLRFSTQHRNRRWQQSRPLPRVTQWHAGRRRWASAIGPKRWGSAVVG